MSLKRSSRFAVAVPWRIAFLAMALAAGLASSVSAQPKGTVDGNVGGVVTANTPAGPTPAAANTGGVIQAGCASCSNPVLNGPPLAGPVGFVPGDCPTCGCGGCCFPGRRPCDCPCDGFWGKCFGGLYQAICCPDPCYEPTWVSIANASLFTDPARPVTQIRLRGDFGWDYTLPDKAEYFWARVGGFTIAGTQTMSNGKGPRHPGGDPGAAPNPMSPILVPNFGENRLDYRDGSLYIEGALELVGVFIELPYRAIDPETYPAAAGLGDLVIGTKTLLLDSELLQYALQFKIFTPTGNFTKGLGTGHVSLEPSWLAACKLGPDTWFQYQLAYWFPLGGDNDAQGPVFHYHLSLNQLLCRCGHHHTVELIGTLEATGYEITGGAYTDPTTGFLLRARDVGNILNVGPGIRLNVCNKVDFGMGAQIAVTSDHLAQNLFRAEFRCRF